MSYDFIYVVMRFCCCAFVVVAQMSAQVEVVTQATNKKLNSLPAGDFEETDSQLEEFTSKFEEVRSLNPIFARSACWCVKLQPQLCFTAQGCTCTTAELRQLCITIE